MILCSLGPLKFQELTISSLSQILLYSNTLIYKEKRQFLNATTEYVLFTERFNEPLIS